MRMALSFDEQPPRLVRLTDDVYVASSFRGRAEGSGLPCPVTIRVVVDETGPRVEEVTLSGRSISSEDLRSVPLARLRDISVRLASFRPLAAEGEITGAAWGGRDETITAALRQQRRVIDDTHLHEVAETYVGAESNPTSTVAEKFGVPRPTAARWVSLARERSLLPPAKRGRDPR